MRKFVVAIVVLAALAPARCRAQELPAPEQNVRCSVFLEKHGRGRAQQGMELWGKYLFSLEDGGRVNVYNFRKASPDPIASFDLASSRPDNHANNASFGIEKKKGASFPLLYVTNGKVGSEIEYTCFVESITLRKGVFTSEIAQTITLDPSGWADKGYTAIFGAPAWMVDRERGFLWVFSAVQRTTTKVTLKAEDNKYVATRFRVPKLSEGAAVTLGVEDILDQVVFPFDVWVTQAGCVHNGKIYYCFGFGRKHEQTPSRIRVYDTDARAITARYELREEVPYEMEDIVVKGKWMYVNTNTSANSGITPLVYKISLPSAR